MRVRCLGFLSVGFAISPGIKYLSDAFMINRHKSNICRIEGRSKSCLRQKQILLLQYDPDVLKHDGIIDNAEKYAGDDYCGIFISDKTILNVSGCGAKVIFNSHLTVEGTLMGAELFCHENTNTYVTVEKGGELHADISCAENVVVRGRLVGNVSCKKITILSSGELIGDVSAELMSLDEGGTIMGITWCSNSSQKWSNPLHQHHNSNLPLQEGFYFPNEDDAKKFNATSLNNNIKKNLTDKKVEVSSNRSHQLFGKTSLNSKKISFESAPNHPMIFNDTDTSKPNGIQVVKPDLFDNTTKKLYDEKIYDDATISLKTSRKNSTDSNNIKISTKKVENKHKSKQNHDEETNSNITPEKKKNKYLPISPKLCGNDKYESNYSRFKATQFQNSNSKLSSSLFRKKEVPTKSQGPPLKKNLAKQVDENLLLNHAVKSESVQLKKKSTSTRNEKFVDDFGNPLLRGAGHDQVVSFRECRGLCKETRDLLEQAKRSKTKAEVEFLTRGHTSPSLQKDADNSKVLENKVKRQNIGASSLKNDEVVGKKMIHAENDKTQTKKHLFTTFPRRMFKNWNNKKSDDIIPPFLQQ